MSRAITTATSFTIEDWRAVYKAAGISADEPGQAAIDKVTSVAGTFGLSFEDFGKRMAGWSEATFEEPGQRVGYWRPTEHPRHLRPEESHNYSQLLAAKSGQHVSRYISDYDFKRTGTATKAEFLEREVAVDVARYEALNALPWPHATTWDPDIKARVLKHLRRGTVKHSWCGYSTCRICGAALGSTCLTDGEWIWPDGLDHYVKEHDVALPAEFIAHALKSKAIRVDIVLMTEDDPEATVADKRLMQCGVSLRRLVGVGLVLDDAVRLCRFTTEQKANEAASRIMAMVDRKSVV